MRRLAMNWIPNLASLVIPGIWDFPPNGAPEDAVV
jgi:hypothetical protein